MGRNFEGVMSGKAMFDNVMDCYACSS